MLKFSVRSCYRMWIRMHLDLQDKGKRTPKYCRERSGFDGERWKREYGKETFGRGMEEIFSKE